MAPYAARAGLDSFGFMPEDTQVVNPDEADRVGAAQALAAVVAAHHLHAEGLARLRSAGGTSALPAATAAVERRVAIACSGIGATTAAALCFAPPPLHHTACVAPLPVAQLLATSPQLVAALAAAFLDRHLRASRCDNRSDPLRPRDGSQNGM